jgi:hypothetical protein
MKRTNLDAFTVHVAQNMYVETELASNRDCKKSSAHILYREGKWKRLHVKYPLVLSDFNETWNF